MSISEISIPERVLQNNEEALALREIFNIIEDKKINKSNENRNNDIIEKYKIKNIKIEKLNIINNGPKNRYKLKLQKILLKKNS